MSENHAILADVIKWSTSKAKDSLGKTRNQLWINSRADSVL